MIPMHLTIGNLVGGATSDSLLHLLQTIFQFLIPTEHVAKASLPTYALSHCVSMLRILVWFLLIGIVVYALALRKSGRTRAQMFRYAPEIREPGEKFSVVGAWNYLMPYSIYTHPSFRIDMLWLPFSIVLNFFGFLGVTLGPGIVQKWMLQHFGHSPVAFPENALTIALQVAIILLARDFSRFMWHYQGHVVPFFWEFHKGHHSIEALHVLGVRTHPVDMFIRNTYYGVGSGLIGGSLIYLMGMNYSVFAAYWVVLMMAVFAVGEIFEHSHVRVSFGKTMNRFFYAPYMHHFHHGAGPEHMNVNLGITGGLILWDYLFGTLYLPQPGEKVVWGASLEELGERNPHRTLKGFLWGPFVCAFRTLRRPAQPFAGNAPVA